MMMITFAHTVKELGLVIAFPCGAALMNAAFPRRKVAISRGQPDSKTRAAKHSRQSTAFLLKNATFYTVRSCRVGREELRRNRPAGGAVRGLGRRGDAGSRSRSLRVPFVLLTPPLSSLLKRLLKGGGRCSRMTELLPAAARLERSLGKRCLRRW